MTDRTVGIIGVGLMGHGIAINIVRKGWRLNYLRHPGNQPTGDLDARGAVAFDTADALARSSDIVILCLNGSPQVEEVMLGSGGVVEALRPGCVVIDCTTAIPSSTRAIATRVAAVGGRFMDAAMTRTPLEAEEGRLNLLIGADRALHDEMLPLLDCFSENRFHAGGVGAGHALKLLHNFVSIGCVTLIGEAFACAEASGVAGDVLLDALRKGGGQGVALERVAPFVLEGDSSKMRFSVANARKDLDYYVRLAADAGACRGVADGVLGTLDALTAAGMEARFLSEAPSALAEVAGRTKGA